MKHVEGKTFLVTGGASGLGEACVRLLFENLACVVILDIKQEDGQRLVDQLGSPERVLFVKTDVCSEDSVQGAIKQSIEKFRKIHGVINCAGVGSAQKTAGSAPHSLDLFKLIVGINLTGTFNVCRLVAQAMIAQEPDSEGERGVMINTASISAYEGQIGQVAYSASKGGVVSMTIVMARDLYRYGIRCVTIAPGTFDTGMLGALPEAKKEALQRTIPFPPRLGRPEEFAHLVLSILQNPYINGETIRLDAALRMAAF